VASGTTSAVRFIALGAIAVVIVRCASTARETRLEIAPAPVTVSALPDEPPAAEPPPSASLSSSSPPQPLPREPGRADLDPGNDWVVAPPDPVADCDERLASAGIRFAKAALPVRSAEKGTITCGAEQVVEYRGSSSGIRYNAAPVVTCTLALALARFEAVLQDEAERRFHSRVQRLEQAGTYNCRKMSRFRDMVSEHSYANAIDVRGVTLANGRTINVLRDFGKLDLEPTAEASVFLREVAHRAFDEEVFSVVLTPYFDALHRDHFHLDMARYRVDGTH
jgi:hypothetical protein